MSEGISKLADRVIEDADWMAIELSHTGGLALNVISELEKRKGSEFALRFAIDILKLVNTAH